MVEGEYNGLAKLMNITKHEKMYHIIRERVTGNFMKELLEMKPQKK